jgi:hypothetical protein
LTKPAITAKVTKEGKSDVGRIRKVLTEKMRVLVGIPSDAVPYPDGTSVAKVAASHEFGVGNPERSFLRSTVKEKRKHYKVLTEKAIVDSITGKKKLKTSLSKIGSEAKSDVQQKIIAIKTPPNSPATIEKKGSSNPLFDNGHMVGSITYEVVDA